MDWVIYSNGPDLARTMCSHPERTIAVNGAINLLATPPDWFVALDLLPFKPHFTMQRPRLGYCTREVLVNQIPWKERLVCATVERLPGYEKVRRLSFSITAAYLLAIAQGATKIITYGEDWRAVKGHDYSAIRATKETQEREDVLRAFPHVMLSRVTCSTR